MAGIKPFDPFTISIYETQPIFYSHYPCLFSFSLALVTSIIERKAGK